MVPPSADQPMTRPESSTVDVVLVVPPFADVERPALGPSLLAAALGQRGLRAVVVYPNLAWAERIGLPLYAWFANRGEADAETTALALSTLVSEWVFADLASDRIDATPSYGERFLAPALDPATLARVLATLELREAFVCETVEQIQRLRPRIVGFTTTLTSMTAGLALARRLAAGPDRPLIVFGGSACEEAMGAALLAAFDVVDWVCSGEGEVAFVEFAAAIVAGERPHVAGMRSRGGLARTPAPVAMDSLPIPDFRDYFVALARSPLREQLRPRLPFESSRGCWWGQKHHCSFCGLNGATMQFRAKTPERALTELRTLVDTWQIADVEAVDNIVDHRYFASVFPRLAAEGPEVRLFYEIKSNLDRDDVALLRRPASGGFSRASRASTPARSSSCARAPPPRRTSACCAGVPSTASAWPGTSSMASRARIRPRPRAWPSSSRCSTISRRRRAPAGSASIASARCSPTART